MSELPDKQYLYGRYMDHENWRQKLHKKLAHKSLDIPEDDDMYVDNSRKGMTWKELAAIGLIGLGGVGAFAYMSQEAKPPVDSEYEVLFYDQEGNPIQVPHISTKPE